MSVLQQGQRRRLQKAISARVYQLTSVRNAQSVLFKALYSALKERYNVDSYKSINPKDLQTAIRFIENWKG
ncbi:ORF6C domain-containing protein [Lysinibacillus sp. UGB7]